MKNAREFFDFLSGAESAKVDIPNSVPDFLFIGELANKLDINPKTIRYYEREGLLKPTRHGSFRTYLNSDIEQLSVILAMRKLGVSIANIKLLSTVDEGAEGKQFIENSLRDHLDLLNKQKLILDEQLRDTGLILDRLNDNSPKVNEPSANARKSVSPLR